MSNYSVTSAGFGTGAHVSSGFGTFVKADVGGNKPQDPIFNDQAMYSYKLSSSRRCFKNRLLVVSNPKTHFCSVFCTGLVFVLSFVISVDQSFSGYYQTYIDNQSSDASARVSTGLYPLIVMASSYLFIMICFFINHAREIIL